MDNKYNIIIIGGGPIGLACGIAAQEANLSYLILEKGCLVNSLYHYPTNMTFFSTSEKLEIGDTPFVTISPKPKKAEALEYYRRIQQKFNLNIHAFEEVLSAPKGEDGLFSVTTNKRIYKTQFVIVATGFYDIPIPLHIPGEQLAKVTHYYYDPHYYSGQDVLVVGASNSAVDAALETYRKGANVTLVVRGSEISPRVKYWVRPDIENRISNGEINVYYNSQVTEITSSEVKIETPNSTVFLKNDFVIALTGYQPNFKFLADLNIHVPKEAPCIPDFNPETMETNVENMYLAGVVCGGLNTHLWFIENSRIHADMILSSIKNQIKPLIHE